MEREKTAIKQTLMLADIPVCLASSFCSCGYAQTASTRTNSRNSSTERFRFSYSLPKVSS